MAHLYARLHARLYRWTGGLLGGAIRVAAGPRPPVLLLETTGRRSGAPRTSPLIYLRDGAELVVIAANAGHPSHPAWWLNLEADPRATVTIGGDRFPVAARVVDGPRRAELWRRFAAMYEGIDAYQAQSPRPFPVVVLTPTSA
jgi:deazaflavin-dependent oxidoreductase (nitroreductase family)